MAFAILRAEKLKTMGNVGGSLAHNYRTIETPNADPSRTPDNSHSLPTPEAVKAAISERLPEKRRSDAVLCIEYMITASPEWKGWDDDRQKEYFDQAKQWLEQQHGKQNVVATSIHRDETTPHLIAYVVPLDQETGRLNAKKFLGGKAKLAQMQSDFADRVKNLGLDRGIEGSKAKHTRIKEYYATVNSPTPQTAKVDRPKPAIFETTAQYGDKVVNSVLEQIKPQWESMAELTKEVRAARKDAAASHKTLIELQKRVKPYLDSIRPLSFQQRMALDNMMAKTSKAMQEERATAEIQKKQQQEQAKIERWEKIYSNLTSDQQVKVEVLMSVIAEKFKDDPALLNQKTKEAQDKIASNPMALDNVPLPTIKTQQDIAVNQQESKNQRSR